MEYKILSLDGGGSWAILQLLTLKHKYGNLNGHEILKEFDMVIANSGGSIVLAALAENWPLNKALQLFDKKDIRETIFSKNSYWERFWPIDYFKSYGPKYSTKRKGESFKRLFPEVDKRQMIELPNFIGKPSLKIIVCTYDTLNKRAKFFKSYGSGEFFDSVRLTQAIHGSSNAPLKYFDFPARFKTANNNTWYNLWDGALGGFNNPIVAGIIEAKKNGIDLNKLKVISIGTGNKLVSIDDKNLAYKNRIQAQKSRGKKLYIWLFKYQYRYFKDTLFNQATTILSQPPDWSTYVAFMFLSNNLLDDDNRIIRLSPIIHDFPEATSDAGQLITKLYKLDMDLTSDEDVNLLKECFSLWSKGQILNQPIHYKVKRDNELIFKQGDRFFEDAMRKW